MKTSSLFFKLLFLPVFLIMPLFFSSCELLTEEGGLTEEQVIEGLKEALKVGTTNTVAETNQTDGYFGNSLIKIPFPEEAATAENYIRNTLNLNSVVDEFILKLNRAAENASIKAKPIIVDAIVSITITDAWNILKGQNNAATTYLHDKTYTGLYDAFKPDINTSLSSVGASQLWNSLTTQYNSIANSSWGLLNPVNTDLPDYATSKALDGLFKLIEKEEEKIRIDPAARVTEILQKVFGELD